MTSKHSVLELDIEYWPWMLYCDNVVGASQQ
jgi:hypothetical protein